MCAYLPALKYMVLKLLPDHPVGNPLKPFNVAEYFGCLMNLVTSYDKNISIFYVLLFDFSEWPWWIICLELMTLLFCKCDCSLFFKQEMELSLIGLQNAGKTSLVNVVAVSKLPYWLVLGLFYFCPFGLMHWKLACLSCS